MPSDTDAQRDAAIDDIIERIERLRAEMSRLRQYAVTLKHAPATREASDGFDIPPDREPAGL